MALESSKRNKGALKRTKDLLGNLKNSQEFYEARCNSIEGYKRVKRSYKKYAEL